MYYASIGVTTNMQTEATKWIAQNADQLGVHSIWIGEDIGIGQNVFVLSSSTLIQSRRTRVGTGIIPVSIHHIATLARAALSLQEIGEGRFIFGTGIGGIQDLQKLGIHIKKPVTVLRESIQTLRALWSGEEVTIQNELFKLDEFKLHIQESKDIPVFLGVRGPQMLRLTGQVADGAILSGPLDYLRYAVKEIDRSAEMVSRNPSNLEKVAWLPTIPTFKGGKESLAKKVVAIVVADTPKQVLDLLDIDHERVKNLREAVAQRGPEAGIPFINDEIMDMFAITGSREHMVDVFEKISQIGITEVVLGPPFSGNWREAVSDIFMEIVSRKE